VSWFAAVKAFVVFFDAVRGIWPGLLLFRCCKRYLAWAALVSPRLCVGPSASGVPVGLCIFAVAVGAFCALFGVVFFLLLLARVAAGLV
ncbi:hypothetical protein U1Q18_017838, partial [Sarracenia purpurea var. burkii]